MSEPPTQPPPIQPMRVEPLAYYTGLYGPVRPGILVAVGIVSIIVGSLSILFSCGGVYTGFVSGTMRVVMTPTTVPVSNGRATATGNDEPPVMRPDARRIAIAGIERARSLSEARRAMLDKLLAKCGDRMFPFSDSLLTEQRVADNVAQSGQSPDAAGTLDDYFILANGRIEIGDDHASFSPSARGEETVRVYADHTSSASAGPVTYTTIMKPTIVATPLASRSSHLIYGIVSIIDMALAIFLLCAGIMTLRGSLGTRRMHLLYAFMKLPLIVAGAFAYYHIIIDQMSGIPLGAPMAAMAVGMASVQVIPALAYPIALLIVMNVKSVKTYYRVGIADPITSA